MTATQHISLFQPTVITGLQELVSQSNNIASLYYPFCVLWKKISVIYKINESDIYALNVDLQKCMSR
jgi:hypothetical protein